MDPQELVPVYTTNDPTLASILVNALKDDGIAATAEGSNQAGLAGIIDIRILVKAWDADRAREVINTHPHAAAEKPPHRITDPRQT